MVDVLRGMGRGANFDPDYLPASTVRTEQYHRDSL
jgi:hypothetical protein